MNDGENHLKVFLAGKKENPRFWARFGGKPDFKGKRVLDVGCGTGSLCLDISLSGAKQVVGVDIDPVKIAFANAHIKKQFPEEYEKIDYKVSDLKDIPDSSFDCIVTKDTFEHVMHFEDFFAELIRILKKGGHLYSGFGPLYRSPFGFHRRLRRIFPILKLLKHPIPWIHLLFTDSAILNRVNRKEGSRYRSIPEYGLNKMTFAEFIKIFKNSGLSIKYLEVNVANHVFSKIISFFRQISFLREYFTYNVYVIFKK
ncbi:MAG: methyltransferase domain-containing protein [Candidatus Hodarchaeota archaeon]